MTFELYKKILDEGAEKGLCSIKLSYRGEPLLHPQVVQMVRYAKERGLLDIYFNTNGMLLTEKLALKLMDSGLDRISISVEGTDPVAFERNRRGARFERILHNVDGVMALRENRGLTHPRIRVQTVLIPGLNLDEYRKFWIAHCDEVAAVDYKDARNRNTTLIDETWACPQLWQRMTIEWDGTIMPCNNDDLKHLSPGNVKEKSITEGWHDAMVHEARALHKQGKAHLLKSCNGCPWRTTQIRKQTNTSIRA
jgi:radical SAM protein with 4Fe4S-binding SPASM domain